MCIYIFDTQGEKKPMWNKTIVNLLQLSNLLTSCRLLHQLWNFSKNILLFNKSFVKKYSQTIFSSPFHSTIVSKYEE